MEERWQDIRSWLALGKALQAIRRELKFSSLDKLLADEIALRDASINRTALARIEQGKRESVSIEKIADYVSLLELIAQRDGWQSIVEQLRRIHETVLVLKDAEAEEMVAAVDETLRSYPVVDIAFDEPRLLTGKQIDGYFLAEFLGAGGGGCVFRCAHPDLGDRLAIKLFHPFHPAYAHLTGLIARGFNALSRLRHPSIIRVHSHGCKPFHGHAVPYLVMSLVQGQDLQTWSKEQEFRPDAFQWRLRVASQIAEGMLAAHSTRYVDEFGFEVSTVLHGDLKPANILVASDARAVIIDFLLVGVHRLVDQRIAPSWVLRRNATGKPQTLGIGTPGFMAPEQAERGVVSVASDIYSLGITFCHLFFPTNPEPAWTLASSNELPATLKQVLCRMLANAPHQRPSSLAEVVEVISTVKAYG